MEQLIQRATQELDWGYIMSTLLIRFVGVFIVLAILLIGMQVLGAIVSRLVARQEMKSPKKSEKRASTAALIEPPETKTGEEELVAAIGATIALAMESEQKAAVPSTHPGVTADSWTMAGRVALMNGRLQGGSQRRP